MLSAAQDLTFHIHEVLYTLGPFPFFFLRDERNDSERSLLELWRLITHRQVAI